MKNTRLAEIFAIKYKVAASPADLEIPLRKKLITLWNYPNKLFNVLKACSESEPSKGKEVHENKAYAGYKFCKNLIQSIDYLKENANTISLAEMKDRLVKLVASIDEQKDQAFSPKGNPSSKAESSGVQFPHVGYLIHEMIPISRRTDVKLRNDLTGKARTGLSRIHSFSLDLLKDLQELESIVPDKFESAQDDEVISDRFSPQRSALSNHDITDFIRQYGPSYGIYSRDDWNVVTENPQLKEELTTVVNALNRGQIAVNDVLIRENVAKALRNHQEKQNATTPHFEGAI